MKKSHCRYKIISMSREFSNILEWDKRRYKVQVKFLLFPLYLLFWAFCAIARKYLNTWRHSKPLNLNLLPEYFLKSPETSWVHYQKYLLLECYNNAKVCFLLQFSRDNSRQLLKTAVQSFFDKLLKLERWFLWEDWKDVWN